MTKQPQRLGIGEARMALPSVIDAAADGERFIVTLYGKDRCAIVPLSDLPESMRPAQDKPAKRQPK